MQKGHVGFIWAVINKKSEETSSPSYIPLEFKLNLVYIISTFVDKAWQTQTDPMFGELPGQLIRPKYTI